MTPEIREQGLHAYEQARAFEQLRRRRVPLIYALVPLLFILFGLLAEKLNRGPLAEDCFASAALIGICAWWNWQRLRALYARNLALLANLESQHGESLPWLEVERHFAALDKLNAELAKETELTKEKPTKG
jgi:hypothetical protein